MTRHAPAALLAAICGVWACRPTPLEPVVVVGGGVAGLAAAIQARDSGAPRVILIEAQDQAGGAARLGQAVTHLPDADEITRWEAAAGPTGSGAWTRTDYAQGLEADVVGWPALDSVTWVDLPGTGRKVAPRRGGAELVEALVQAAEVRGVQTLLSTRVTGFAQGPGGIRVRTDGGDHAAGAVVIATGGWAGDVMRAQAVAGTPVLRGAPAWADGGGESMGQTAGGAVRSPTAMLFYGHGTPDPRQPQRALVLHQAERVWTVDAQGQPRPELVVPRGPTGNALLAAGGGRGWAVFDAEVGQRTQALDWEAHGRVPLAELARTQGACADTPSGLEAALELPQGAVAAGVGPETTPRGPDAPLRIAHTPLCAVPLLPTTAKSLTGLESDADGRLLDTDGRPVPGFYVAGEVGAFGHVHRIADPGAQGVASGVADSTMAAGAVLTGRVAGASAARQLTGG